MGRLVAVRETGPAFVDRLRRIWDAGDAAYPVHPGLPAAAADRMEQHMGVGLPVDPDDALVVATSGTTGEPKGVVLTHAAVEAAARATSSRLGVDPAADHWLACLPLAHVGGLGVVTRALVTGTPLTVHERFDAEAVETAGRGGCTRVALVATALRRLDPTVFRTVLLGGGPAPDDAPPNAVVTYGLTESGGGVVYDGVPLDGVDVRIGPGGVIDLRGPMLLRRYRDGFDPRDADGWLRTGDVGEFDSDGRLRVLGRSSDLIITGGENVWPAAVEAVLRDHPAVADCAVIGRPDPEWGERVEAYLEPAPGVRPPPPPAEVRDWASHRLPRYALPRRMAWAPLPRTSLGKVVRRALPPIGPE